MNLELLVVALVVAKAVDWIVQSQWQAENKTKKMVALWAHSMWYATTTWIILLILFTSTFYRNDFTSLVFFLGLFISHAIIDNRWVVKQIMIHVRHLTKEQVYGVEQKWAWLEVGIDQRLHDLVVVALVMVI